MPRRACTDKDFAGIAVGEEGSDGVENAPARDHVVLVGVVFDVWDGRGRLSGACSRRVVELGGCGAEGVDFLRVMISPVPSNVSSENDRNRDIRRTSFPIISPLSSANR